MATKTYEQLQKEISALQAKAAEQRKKEYSAVIADIQQKMQAYGITLDDLKSSRGPAKGKRGRKKTAATGTKRGPVAAKYRDASTGDTWSGRGRAPRWLAAHEAAGRSREEFAV